MEARRCAAICAVGALPLGLGPAARAGHAFERAIVPVDQASCDDMKQHNVIRAGMPVGSERLTLVKFS
jgi:hypothetical protein